MSDDEMRVKIAEACGWTYQKRESWPKHRPKRYEHILQAPDDRIKVLPEFTVAHANPETDRIQGMGRLPDYLNDLNAMHQAEQMLTDNQRRGYCGLLIDQCAGGEDMEAYFDRWPVFHATARQRAEAFLRTIAP